MNDRHQGATAVIHTCITDHQGHLSHRSPLALGHSRSMWSSLPPRCHFHSLFFFLLYTTLYCFITSMTGQSWLQTSRLATFANTWTLGLGSPSQTHLPSGRRSLQSPRAAWPGRIYEHKQLFKLRLFTDNLLTIQLFILRRRPSPSHRQMKKKQKNWGIVKDFYAHILQSWTRVTQNNTWPYVPSLQKEHLCQNTWSHWSK